MTQSQSSDGRVLALFEAALAYPSADRRDWIIQQAADDDALREGVLKLLAEDEAGLSALRTGGASAGLIGTTDSIPERIGAYRITGLIGRGGIGVVYEGRRDQDDFDHRVAIKVTRTGLVSPALTQRFQSERRILASLSHPGIAQLYDGGAMEDGAPYMVMEYVDGQSITKWADHHACSKEQRMDLFDQVLAAVEYAHQNLIIHRDITPNNVLVTEQGMVKIIDFGISRPQTSDDSESAHIPTSYRSFTPGYAAPEVAQGAPANILTDIYSLGGLLSELLAYMALDKDLEAIITKATAIDPEERYGSVDAFRNDLERYRQGRTVSAVNGGGLYAFRSFFKRHRLSVSAAGLAVVALITGLIVTTDLYREAETARAEADRRFAEVRQLANTMLFDITDELSFLPGTVKARDKIYKTGQSYLEDVLASNTKDLILKAEIARGLLTLAKLQGSFFSGIDIDTVSAKANLERVLPLFEELMREDPNNPDYMIGLAETLKEQYLIAVYTEADYSEGRRLAQRIRALSMQAKQAGSTSINADVLPLWAEGELAYLSLLENDMDGAIKAYVDLAPKLQDLIRDYPNNLFPHSVTEFITNKHAIAYMQLNRPQDAMEVISKSLDRIRDYRSRTENKMELLAEYATALNIRGQANFF